MLVGECVADRFEIVRSGGAGGMSDVFLAVDIRSGEHVALKIVHGTTPASREQFESEAHVLRLLQHPAIVRYVDHGATARGEQYLAMEWLEGEDLSERLCKGPLSVGESLVLARRVAEALAVAHIAGVVHRDIKPENLFLAGRQISRTKIVDFGIALLTGAGAGDPSTAAGTPGYAAPEQFRGNRTLDTRADVYSVGCVWFRALTGRHPRSTGDASTLASPSLVEEPESVRAYRSDVPDLMDALIARMLATFPRDRPRDGAELLGEVLALGRLVARETTSTTVPRQVPQSADGMMRVVVRSGREPGEKTAWETAGPASIALRSAVERVGARLDVMGSDILLATIPSRSTEREQAVRALRCARAILDRCPGALVAVVGARAELTAESRLGDQLERAASLLRLRPEQAVRLDDGVATLLQGWADVRLDGAGSYLRSEAAPSLPAIRSLTTDGARSDRSSELVALRQLMNRAVTSETPSAALVVSPAALDAPWLASEVLHGLQHSRTAPEIWIAAAARDDRRHPLGLLARLVRSIAGISESADDAAVRRAIRTRIDRRVLPHDRARVHESLSRLVATISHEPERRDASASEVGEIERAWIDFVTAETRVQPVMIVLEGLEHADSETLGACEQMVRALPHARLMLIGVGRPEIHLRFSLLWDSLDVHEIAWGKSPTRSGEQRIDAEVLEATRTITRKG